MPCGDFPLNGKIVAVTGGGSGINFSFAEIAVQQGAHVIIADLRLTPDAESYLKGKDPKTIVFVKCDVSKRVDLENIVKVSRDTHGKVPDVYIAGAGVFEPSWSNWWDDTEDDGYAQMDINTMHPLKFARIALRALLSENKPGVILIVASLSGYLGTFAAPLYTASKHAVIGFVRSMSDLDRLASIKVTAVAPGMVATPLWTASPEKMKQFSYDPETAVPPEAVADAMIECVTLGKHAGGTSIEVSKAGTRALGTWNIDPPMAKGTSFSQEVIDASYAPLLALMQKEREMDQK